MPVLERLRLDHAPELFAFERKNRAYFAASVPDRGDGYFSDFDARHRALLAEQEAGLCHFHVLVDGDGGGDGGGGGSIVGRVNLVDVAGGAAELGYRIAEQAAGRGLATAAVAEVCGIAARQYGLTRLRAATTLDNAASRRVLERTGFTPVGATTLDGRPGIRFVRRLA